MLTELRYCVWRSLKTRKAHKFDSWCSSWMTQWIEIQKGCLTKEPPELSYIVQWSLHWFLSKWWGMSITENWLPTQNIHQIFLSSHNCSWNYKNLLNFYITLYALKSQIITIITLLQRSLYNQTLEKDQDEKVYHEDFMEMRSIYLIVVLNMNIILCFGYVAVHAMDGYVIFVCNKEIMRKMRQRSNAMRIH